MRLERPRIGISSCLLGQRVRYDGGHKKDAFLTQTFGRFVEWVAVCPEVEVGMGTPRESIRLVGAGLSRQGHSPPSERPRDVRAGLARGLAALADRGRRPAQRSQAMEALGVPATARKHVNVLTHLAGYFSKQLSAEERAELAETIADYHHGLVPLIVPITLIRHYVKKHRVAYIQDQVYLQPHPKELMLRNHV